MKITILTPVYNDWKSASKLIEEINTIVKDLDAEFSLVIVNDASTEEKPTSISNTENLLSVEILNIKNNQGHGRCIATGLKHIFQNKEFDYVIPMDSDGEDRPEEIKSFLEYIKYDEGKPIVGERVKISENFIIKISYHFNRSSSPSERGTRYFGPSKMSFKNLIKHSLAIIAVFKSTVIIRSILFYAIYLILMADYISVVTAIPLALIIAFGLSVVMIGRRENLEELNNALTNIHNIDKIK